MLTTAFPQWGAFAGLTHHFGKTTFGMTRPLCGGKHVGAHLVDPPVAPLCRDCAAIAGIDLTEPLAANARPLISRNKREGGYCGRECTVRRGLVVRSHRRVGVSLGDFSGRVSLRDWAKEWKC